jgi:hypothetical protein
MKVLFLADNDTVLEMYAPIINKLSCEVRVFKVDYEEVARLKPDVIVLAREDTSPEEHTIINCGIPTLLIPHGMLMPNVSRKLWGDNRYTNSKFLLIQGFKKLMKGDSPLRLLKVGLFRLRNDYKEKGIMSNFDGFTKIASYGEVMSDILIRYHVKPENIVVTGNPKFDKYYNQPKAKKGYVLLLTEYFVEFGIWSARHRENFVRDVYLCAKQCGLDLVVKIHPVLEYREDYEKLAKKYPFKLYHKEDTCNLILNCDMAITIISSTGLEVMVAEKPLIIYNSYNMPTLYEEGVLNAKNPSELLTAMQTAKNGLSNQLINEARHLVAQNAYIQDGKSAERIANLILEMGNDTR